MRGFLFFLSLLGACTHAADMSTARALFDEKRYPEAEAAFTALIAARPADAEAHAYLGRLALARQNLEAAITHFERAVALEPARAEFQFLYGTACLPQAAKLGLSFKSLGLVRKGRSALEAAVQLDPAKPLPRQALIEFYAQAPAVVGGGMDKAYAQVEALRTHDSRAAAFAYANLQFRQKRFAEAAASIEPLLADNPDDYQALYFIGRVAAETGALLERGIASLRRCLELPVPPRLAGHAAVNLRLGEALLKQGDRAAARTAFEASLALDPDYAPARAALDRLGAR